MYSSNSTYDEKASSKPPVSSAPTSYGQSTIGVPLSFNQHPGAYQTQTATEGPWSTSLCGCFEDVPNCCITCWCPCVTFGQIAEIVDQGSTSCALSGGIYSVIGLVTGCACMYSCIYRTKMRRQFMLQESPCPDCLLHCCCEHLALCQEYRELQHRGFDVSKGWQGNMERQNDGIRMAPVVDEGMSR